MRRWGVLLIVAGVGAMVQGAEIFWVFLVGGVLLGAGLSLYGEGK